MGPQHSLQTARQWMPSLTVRYVVALAAIALLIIAGQLLIQSLLVQQRRDSRVVNLSGRQRMLSQKIAKQALAMHLASGPEARLRLASELERDLHSWTRVHRGLQAGDAGLGLPANDSARIRALFDELEPHFAAMRDAAESLVRAGSAPAPLFVEAEIAPSSRIREHEGPFLALMDEITNTFDQEAFSRVEAMGTVELWLALAALLLLMLEALFIFRPALRRLNAYIAELASARSEFEQLSYLDGLTGIPNRRSFDRDYPREWSRSAREGKPISVIMLDVDGFKLLNDTLGHREGDRALAQIASCLRAQLQRPGDVVARYGGDEFVALLPATDHSGAHRVASRMQHAIGDLRIRLLAKGRTTQLSVSVGVATAKPALAGGPDPDSLLASADRCLYQSKAARAAAVVGGTS